MLSIQHLAKDSGRIDTILFDLDDTLIKVNELFRIPLAIYTSLRFRNYFSPLMFPRIFLEAVEEIKRNKGEDTNFSVFTEYLALHSSLGESGKQELIEVIQASQREDLPKIARYFSPYPGASRSLELAKEKKIRLVLATNPVFPLEVVEFRMRCGGIDPHLFEFISHSQNMSRCKPDPEYYAEVIKKASVDPSHALMIGNDPRNDLPARELGIRTLILNSRLSRLRIWRLKPRGSFYFGTHEGLQALIEGIPVQEG